jgi:hypothetical protein
MHDATVIDALSPDASNMVQSGENNDLSQK